MASGIPREVFGAPARGRVGLHKILGITREDAEGRNRQLPENFRLFSTPAHGDDYH